MNVRLTKEQKVKVLNSAAVYGVMQRILMRENEIRRNQEHFWVVGLDNKNKILFIELVALGRVNRVHANPPDVFRMGIYKLAVSMILVHNHPSGDTKPSQTDQEFTDKMFKVGKLINIDVTDHLIVSEESYTSFADEGIIEKIKKSGLFEIVEREKEDIKEWKLKMERERIVKEERLKTARILKAEGMDEKLIKKATGLHLSTIRSL